MEQIKSVNIGIDLGTTYCSVSYYDDRTGCELVKENDDTSSFASYIALTRDANNRSSYLFGPTAKNQGSSNALYDSKRLIGKTYSECKALGTETNDWSFSVTEDPKGYAQMGIANPVDGTQEVFYPEEVSGMILMSLMQLVKQRIGVDTPIGNVVVTIPVKFSLAQRNATIRACKIAGIENVELMNEPSASIVEYKRFIEKNKKGTLREGMRILVIDFGGGTLDVCCCQIGSTKRIETNVQVILPGGDQDLGGKHFDEIIRDLIMEKIEDNYSEAMPLLTPKGNDIARVKRAKKARKWNVMIEAEKAKKALSKMPFVQVPLGSILGPDYAGEFISISQAEFEAKCSEKLIPRFKRCVEGVIADAKLTKEQFDLILPIGGTCCIPIVRETINRMFPDVTARADPLFNSLSAVANGAAYQAFRYQTSGVDNDDTLEERLPYGVGIELTEKRMSYHAEKGDKLPVKENVRTYKLNRDFQEVATFALYIGDQPKSDGPGMKYQKEIKVTVPPRTKISDFVMIGKMTITKSGLIHFEVTKEKDGRHLGQMECQLEINFLDNIIVSMRRHVLQFCN